MRVPNPMTTYANRETISNPCLWKYDSILCHIPWQKNILVLLYSVTRLDYTIASYASSGWGIDSFKCPGSPPVIQNFPSRLERCLAFKMQCRWPRTTCKIVTSKPEKWADGLIRSPPGIHAPADDFFLWPIVDTVDRYLLEQELRSIRQRRRTWKERSSFVHGDQLRVVPRIWWHVITSAEPDMEKN